MTIKDIASLAGVSASTVSKVINGKDQSINPATRAKVLQIANEYHYSAYGNIRRADQSRTFVIGILLSDFLSCSELVSGLIEAIQAGNYSTILLEHKGDAVLEAKKISSFSTNRIDALIWEPASLENKAQVEQILPDGNACILLDRYGLGNPFYIDYAAISYALTLELVKAGHRKIACLAPQEASVRSLFLGGYSRCLFDNDLLSPMEDYVFEADEESLYALVRSNCTAAVCKDYETACILYKNMENMHLRIPSQFSITAIRGKEYKTPLFPAVTSIRLSYRDFGIFCAQHLLAFCNGGTLPDKKSAYLPALDLDPSLSVSYPSTSQSKHYLVIGSINADTTFLVPSLPQSGKTVEILDTSYGIGGKGANQALGLAKLKKDVALIANIGNDEDASFIFRHLEKEHVNTQGLERDRTSPTGRAYIYLDSEGESAITLVPGANHTLTADVLKKYESLFVDAEYCLFSCEIPEETIRFGLQFAHSKGVRTIFKPTTLHRLDAGIAKYIDLFVPNRKEALLLCDPSCTSVEEQAEYFFSLGIPTVIITLGHNGCYLKTKALARHFKAADFEAVDSTGGADAFISALASCLGEGCDIERSIQIASIAAGHCVAHQGVASALIDKYTLDSYLQGVTGDAPV